MVSTYDEALWMEEVEKVAPALRVRVAPSARDWRAHLQQLTSYRQGYYLFLFYNKLKCATYQIVNMFHKKN